MQLRAIELKPAEPGLDRTLVLLHGYGANEHDLLPLARELDPRLRAVSLQAPLSLGGEMRAWFSLAQDARGFRFDPAEVRAAIGMATLAIEEIARASPRPILLGFSQGAGMALGVALQRPDLAAAVISLSGVARALGPEEVGLAEKLRGFPVFAAHGVDDPLIPLALGHKLRDDLLRLGLDVDWHEYDMGHMVIPEEIDDTRNWLEKHL